MQEKLQVAVERPRILDYLEKLPASDDDRLMKCEWLAQIAAYVKYLESVRVTRQEPAFTWVSRRPGVAR